MFLLQLELITGWRWWWWWFCPYLPFIASRAQLAEFQCTSVSFSNRGINSFTKQEWRNNLCVSFFFTLLLFSPPPSSVPHRWLKIINCRIIQHIVNRVLACCLLENAYNLCLEKQIQSLPRIYCSLRIVIAFPLQQDVCLFPHSPALQMFTFSVRLH